MIYNVQTNWFKIYMTPVFKSLFSLTTINPFQTAGLNQILHIFAASMGMFQRLLLISENSPFPCIIAMFLDKLLLEFRTFSIFFKSFNSPDIGTKAILLELLGIEFHFHKGAYNIFYMCKIFHHIIWLGDTALKWEFDIFHGWKIWHCVDTGLDGILRKRNSGLVLLVEDICQP